MIGAIACFIFLRRPGVIQNCWRRAAKKVWGLAIPAQEWVGPGAGLVAGPDRGRGTGSGGIGAGGVGLEHRRCCYPAPATC